MTTPPATDALQPDTRSARDSTVYSADFSALPGFSRAWREISGGLPHVFSIFARAAQSEEACRAAAHEQLEFNRPWPELAAVLERSAQNYRIPERIIARLVLLARGRAVAVVTGQQVGYLGGPFYTFLKAYHATRLATHLEERLGVAVLPVFWLEGEDHDLAEVRDAQLLDAAGEPLTLSYSPPHEVTNQSVGRYPLNAEAHFAEIDSRFGGADPEAVALFRRAYSRGTLTESMGSFIAATLGPRGMFVVDGMDRDLKRLAVPLWEKIVKRGSGLSDLLAQRSRDIEAAGYPTPIHPNPDSHLYYLLDNQDCRCSVALNGACSLDGRPRQLSGQDLMHIAQNEPWRMSPKAALRPLYQDTVLPTIAYIAGPGELSYHVQLAPFYAALGVVAPSLFPRFSVTLQDHKTARLLEKMGLTFQQLMSEPEHVLKKSILNATDVTGAAEQFAHAKLEIESIYERLKSLAADIDPTLAGLATSSAGKSLQPLEQLHDKTVRALKQKHAAALTRLDRALAALKPHGMLAERYYSSLYYFARFGQMSVMSALDRLPLEPPQHHIITLE